MDSGLVWSVPRRFCHRPARSCLKHPRRQSHLRWSLGRLRVRLPIGSSSDRGRPSVHPRLYSRLPRGARHRTVMTPQSNQFHFMKTIFRIVRPLVLTVLTLSSFTASTVAQEIIIPDPNLNAV